MKELLSEELFMGGEEAFEPITFFADLALQTWTVPAGIKKIHVDVVASQGANSGGLGGRIECDLSVCPKQILYIMVGGVPSTVQTASYNASDIRTGGTDYTNRIVVAGGGGSKGSGSGSGAGGNGGDIIGADGGNSGCSGGGKGGTQSTGGVGGSDIPWTSQQTRAGAAGVLGLGGDGAAHSGVGGAGGAGYYGGGGGCGGYTKKAGSYGGGGGGGSSFANVDLCLNVVHTQGFRSGSGYVTISMIEK